MSRFSSLLPDPSRARTRLRWALLCLIAAGCRASAALESNAYAWQLPADFPIPVVPGDNPMSGEKVALGRRLFYDRRLSENETFSCATCHQQALAFTDGRGVALGSTGDEHSRGSMSLVNVAYGATLTWADPTLTSLEQQARIPLLGSHPIELGIPSLQTLEARLRASTDYQEWFEQAFPRAAEPVTLDNALRALASFERTLIAGNSAYDRFIQGDLGALSESAQRGMFFVTTSEDERFQCHHCHGGFTFSDQAIWQGQDPRDVLIRFHQTGLYDIDGHGGYPEPNTGVYHVTSDPEDMGKFKAPTLRNIALTAPYMHDGSIATLDEVLEHYAEGGRARNQAATDRLVRPFAISDQEKADIIEFLESLSDPDLLSAPQFGDPW